MWGNNFSAWQNSAANSKSGQKSWFAGRLNWILIVVFGVGGALLLLQLAYPFLVDTDSLSDSVQEQPAAPDTASAGEPAEQTATVDGESDSFLADYDPAAPSLLATDDRPLWQVTADLGVKLAFVIALIYGVIAALRWMQRHKLNSLSDSNAIHVLETTGLAPGRTLHLVEVGHKTLLIGATDHQLTLLTELVPAQASPEQAKLEPADPQEAQQLPDSAFAVATETNPAPVGEPTNLKADEPLPFDHLERMYRQAEPAAEFNQTLDWQVKVGNIRQNMQRIRETSGRE